MKFDLGKCPSGKHQHASRGAAEAHLRSIVRVQPEYSGRPYPCSQCRGWHIGRRPAKSHRNKYTRAS